MQTVVKSSATTPVHAMDPVDTSVTSLTAVLTTLKTTLVTALLVLPTPSTMSVLTPTVLEMETATPGKNYSNSYPEVHSTKIVEDWITVDVFLFVHSSYYYYSYTHTRG